MISAKYNKALINREFIRGLTDETFSDIYSVQATIAQNHKGSGELYQFLSRQPYTIVSSVSGIRGELSYPLKIRYMDMKTDPKTGKPKKNYTPIYNKIVWGFVYGYLYKQLMYGISQQLNEAIINRLHNAGYKSVS